MQKPRGRGQLPSWASMAGTVSLMVLDVFGCLVKGTCTLPSPQRPSPPLHQGHPSLAFQGAGGAGAVRGTGTSQAPALKGVVTLKGCVIEVGMH